VKLTEESAQAIKKFGLRESSKTGLSTGVIKGSKGQIGAFVEFVKGPRSLLTNPAILAGAAGCPQPARRPSGSSDAGRPPTG
jgi:hypothetical protein